MATHAHTVGAAEVARPSQPLAVRLLRAALNRFLLLPLGVLIALVWANTEPEGYFRFAHAVAFPVNEIGMAIFLALIAQELYEALLPGGSLAAWRNRALPGFAALGGFVGSVATFLVYIAIAHEQMLTPAWPVVAAVDIAAGYYLLRVIYPRRRGAVAFLLLVAIVTDSMALAIVSVQAPSLAIHPAGLSLFAAALGLAAWMRRAGVTSFWPYLLTSGPLCWTALYWMGIHPALALVPLVPLLPHDPRRQDVFADRPDDDAVHTAEHRWNGGAQIAVFLFGLANGGVILSHVDTGTWAVLVAAVVGRPLGVMAAVALATVAGFRLPSYMQWKDMAVIALATTSGFTFALFLGAASLPIGAVAEQVTLGALLTITGAFLTLVMAWLLGVGRFKTAG